MWQHSFKVFNKLVFSLISIINSNLFSFRENTSHKLFQPSTRLSRHPATQRLYTSRHCRIVPSVWLQEPHRLPCLDTRAREERKRGNPLRKAIISFKTLRTTFSACGIGTCSHPQTLSRLLHRRTVSSNEEVRVI